MVITRCQELVSLSGTGGLKRKERRWRPSTSRTDENVERVRQNVWSNRRLTVRTIADELGMNTERV